MIWARPLHTGEASALWKRTGLAPEGVGLLRSFLDSAALVTGLSDADRELLAELVDTSWVGGAGDAAVIKYSRHAVEAWLARLSPQSGLAVALSRLVQLETPLPPSPLGFRWGQRTFIMGVLNVTPDSFSDGGKFADPAAAIAHGRALIEAGADLIDVGGESTRPGAEGVSEEVERSRVLPVIEGLKGLKVSIDTQKPGVAEAAIKAGAVLVNDISGLRDPGMLEVIARTGVSACVMHMRGTPKTMQDAPAYADVGAEVLELLEDSLRRAEAKGIPRSRLWVDPGIGFGKTLEHNLELLKRLGDLRLLGCPVLVGVSRKKFLGSLTGRDVPNERVIGSAAAAAIVVAQGGVDVIRVHDVPATREALSVADALR
jgi:dihydropteroate synthase